MVIIKYSNRKNTNSIATSNELFVLTINTNNKSKINFGGNFDKSI